MLVNDTIKIDFPPDSLYHAHSGSLDFSRLEHLLITHSHGDHLAPGELGYLHAPFAHGRENVPLQVWCSHDVAAVIRERFPDPAALNMNLHEVNPFVPLDLGGVQATPIIAVHMDQELCLNWVLGDPDHAVLYASDTGLYETPTWEYLAGVRFDLVISECTHGFVGEARTHMSIPAVQALKSHLQQMGSMNEGCPVVITHFSHNSLLLHEELVERTASLGLTVAWDGIEFEAGR